MHNFLILRSFASPVTAWRPLTAAHAGCLAETCGPHPHIAAQIARDGIPPAEQEVGRSDEEREPKRPGGDIAGGNREPLVEATSRPPVCHPALIHRCGLIPAVSGW